MSKNIIILIVVVVVAVGGFMFYQNSHAPVAAPGTPTPSPEPAPTPAPQTKGAEHKVVFVSDAFSPKEITIKKGDVVTWVNNSDRNIWPASAIHPTHSVYPGSGIEKCDTPDKGKIFDACSPGIASGDSWSFQFNEVGEWRYHDHLRSTVYGKITVTE